MSLAELVITSVLLEGRSKSEVARDYRISRYWVHQLVTRFQVEGEAAYQPRSRRHLHGACANSACWGSRFWPCWPRPTAAPVTRPVLGRGPGC